MTTPATVSIGIEVEFLVAQRQNTSAKSKQKDDRWACDPPPEDVFLGYLSNEPAPWADTVCTLKTCETIAARGFPVGCWYPETPAAQNPITKDVSPSSILQVQALRRIRVWNKRSWRPQSGNASRFDYWLIVREGHIATDMLRKPILTAPKGYDWVPLEINTPIFHGPSELEQGLPQLRQIFTLLREKLILWQNSKCGFHIHVGNGGRDLELDTVKRVVSLVCLLEQPLLCPLYHPSRHTHQNVTMISTGSQLVKEADPPLVELQGEGAAVMGEVEKLKNRLKSRATACNHAYKMLNRIWAVENIATMRRKLRKYSQEGGSSPRGALYPSEYHTIEFRYPEATFDMDFIVRWVTLVRHIFGIALRSREAFAEMLCNVFEMVTRTEMPSWAALTAALGVSVHPDRWRARIKAYKKELHDLDAQPILPKVQVAGFAQSTSMS